MYGAILGDIAGSYHKLIEKKLKEEKLVRAYIEKMMIMDKKIPLVSPYSACTDNSILLCAIADAVMSRKSYEEKLKYYGLREIKLGNDLYGKNKFDDYFLEWLISNFQGQSYDNKGAMRVCPIGYLFDNLADIKDETIKATLPSHNHPDALKSAEAVTTSIYLLRQGFTKEQLKKYIEDNFYCLDFDLSSLRLNYVFTNKAVESVPQAIFCFLKSNNFEDSIRKALSIGGDSDTIATITGSLSEAYYGFPEYLIELVKPYLRNYMIPIIDSFYEKARVKVYTKL